MLSRLHCDQKSQLSGIRIELLNPREFKGSVNEISSDPLQKGACPIHFGFSIPIACGNYGEQGTDVKLFNVS